MKGKAELNKCDVTSVHLSDLCRGCLGLGEGEMDRVMGRGCAWRLFCM